VSLFDGTLDEWMALHPTVPHPSADQRRTAMRQERLRRGVHPLTLLPLLHPGWNRTCGDCDHHVISSGHAKTFHKCDAVPITNGPATDIRVSWPACQKFRESAPHNTKGE
jgi:hypothetical protein